MKLNGVNWRNSSRAKQNKNTRENQYGYSENINKKKNEEKIT